MRFLSILLLIRVLCIGNSFSWDAVEQELVPLCDAQGIEVEIHNLYYGGCSLAQHADFLMRDTAAYSHRICSNQSPSLHGRDGEGFRLIKDTISLRQALRDGKYDYISLQQASHDSGIRASYEPWLSMLIDTVRAYQPEARICWMQTWAYSRDAKHPAYPRYHNDQQEMWDSIQACTRYVLDIMEKQLPSFQGEELCSIERPVDGHRTSLGGRPLLIPCGTAIQLARQTKLGDTLCRDGYHLDYVYGRYTAACVWYEILTGKDVRRNRYKNPQMTCRQARITKEAAHKATSL